MLLDRLLRLLLKPRDRDTIAGDLLEEYREVVLPARGRVRAQLWYLRQALSVIDGVTLGLALGLAFGIWNLIITWLAPLADDTPSALLAFYGPMLAGWGIGAFIAARRSGRVADAIRVGTTIGFVTIVVFYAACLVRVNLFLNTIWLRSDWQNLVLRFHASGSESLRTFANYEYVKGTPLMLGLGCVFGAGMGFTGGVAARMSLLVSRTWRRKP